MIICGSNIRPVRVPPAPRLICIETNPGPGVQPKPKAEAEVQYQLSEKDRWRIIFFHEDMKLSQRDIAKRIPTTRRTVSAVLRKYQQTGTVHHRPGAGRKRKWTSSDENRIVQKAKKGKKAKEIAAHTTTRNGQTVSERTVRRILKRNHLAYLRKKRIQRLSCPNKQARIEYARDTMNANWHRVLFLDEKSFWLESRETHEWQEPGKDRKVEEVERWTKKLNVWGGIGSYFKTDLYFFDRNMNSDLYQQVIEQRLPPNYSSSDIPQSLKRKWVIVQDNAKYHTTDEAMSLMIDLCGNRIHSHPANSPDFNIMEDAWSYLDREVRKTSITTISGLKAKLTRLWKEISWDYIRKSVDSMPARLQQCLDRKGARTDY